MQIGIIGLGRMGMNMARRLIQGGHTVVVYNRTHDKVEAMTHEGAVGSTSVADLVGKLKPPRVALIMLPAGDVTEQHVTELTGLLAAGDILIEGGNSYYKDDVRRAAALATGEATPLAFWLYILTAALVVADHALRL